MSHVLLERATFPGVASFKNAHARTIRTAAEGKHKHSREKLERLIAGDPEIFDRIEGVRKAAAVVADLQAQRALFDEESAAAEAASPEELKRQEKRQAQRAAGRGANEDIIKAADELEQAKSAYTEATSERNKWASAVDEEAERIESGKAAGISAVAASAAGLPFALASSDRPLELFTSVAAVFVTGLLFGVTYRYAVRQDRNLQLKGGVVAAFGLARGAALAEAFLAAHPENFLDLDLLAGAALLCGQSVLSIAFAATALELGFQKGALKPFGMGSKPGN